MPQVLNQPRSIAPHFYSFSTQNFLIIHGGDKKPKSLNSKVTQILCGTKFSIVIDRFRSAIESIIFILSSSSVKADLTQPGEWWSAFGGGCPSLVHFATRILNQPCTLISGKPNRVYFEWINRRMNGIEHARLNDLVFLRSNLRMRGQVKRGENHQWDPIAYENIALAEDWVSGKGLYSDDLGRLDWTAVDPPTGNGLLSGPAIDDEDPSVSGFNDCEIWDF
ncbi:hypothetical protein DM860_010757 [Cuscuta australis]|uniref:HAT C-terminal dimerisation domain-containing protein n=1 Tax=Cuscuta australis TaxID=267555 RepID=A0A328DZU1_9ASTE|nr:hypothetical protein DM860_010757 [Cuscuta australis]